MNKQDEKLMVRYDYGGVGHWYKFDSLILEKKSSVQKIRVFKHRMFGRSLVLDDDLMSTDLNNGYDDAMLELLPDNVVNDAKVLVLGGGDCSLASMLQHDKRIKSIDVIEIDAMVPKVCKVFWPFCSSLGPKVNLVIEDAFKYVERCDGTTYDVIYNDLLQINGRLRDEQYNMLSRKFPGATVIAQTGSCRDEVHKHAISAISKIDRNFVNHERFVQDFIEHWNFTKFTA